jgi:putative ABC transport system substrate-binding protein
MNIEHAFESQDEKENKMNDEKERKQKRRRNLVIGAAVTGVVVVLIVGGLLLRPLVSGETQAKTHTIGVICYHADLETAFDGFKAGLAELGYVEDEDVTYIYNGPMPDPQAGEREVESLVAQDVDLIFTVGTLATLQAKQAVEGTDVPVVFAPVLNPVEEGIVESISYPGGNVTGVQTMGNTLPKTLEWLLKLVPETTKVYVPYNPEDAVSATAIPPLREAAAMLGVELVFGEVGAAEEAMAAIETLPEDVGAIFLMPAPSLGSRISDVIEAATEHGIAVGSYVSGHAEAGALVSYTSDSFFMGKQAARLADQIFQGTAPADLLVKTAEHFLTINLKTAEAIGLDIPDEVLRQANTVIR